MKCRENWLVVTIGIVIVITLNGCKRDSGSSKAKPSDIHEAAENGDIASIEEFLAQGTEVNAKNQLGLTPLHVAAWHGKTNVVELLLAKGADINMKCGEADMTPLHYAAAYGQIEVAEFLIDNGANVNAKSKRGGTPLGNAAMGVGHNREVAELLIANGADINIKNLDGYTPLHKAVMGGQPDIVKLLLSEGTDVNAKDNDGKTPLERAVILSQTQFRRGSPTGKRKKAFQACVKILREYEDK